jgi:hypothetical protein
VPLLAGLTTSVRDVRITYVAAFAAVPRRPRGSEQRVDRGTFFFGWGGVPQV